jgi:hypothetical protein
MRKKDPGTADLHAECRAVIEKSLARPCSKVEAAARESLQEYEVEMRLGREVRDAAAALNQAIRGAMAVARRCRQSAYGDFDLVVRRFVEPFMKSRRELKRLSWRLPSTKRESRKPVTLFVEALDRTNFLGLIDRPATDREMAALFHILGAEILPSQMKMKPRAILKQTIDAIHKCRWVEFHGRPAVVAETRRELAARGVPRAKGVSYL